MALLLIDHGSRRSEANALLDEVVALVKKRLGADAIVEPGHMEVAEPTITQGFARCVAQGATRVVAHPFMLAPGRHVTADLPRILEEVARNHDGVTFVIAPPLGSHPGIIEAIVDGCRIALEDSEGSLA